MVVLGFNFASPLAISWPKENDDKVRIQVVINGNRVDFSNDEFQHTNKNIRCKDGLSSSPMFFADGIDQILYTKWEGVNGKIFLKNYGFENTAPFEGYLGIKINKFPNIEPVPITGDVLPEPEKPYNLYVYTGDKFNYQQKDESAFLTKPFDRFLAEEDKKSVHIGRVITNAQIGINNGEDLNKSDFLRQEENSNDNEITIQENTPPIENKRPEPVENTEPQSSAQSVVTSEKSIQLEVTEKEELTDSEAGIIGNIVVFIQEKEPSEKQVTDRFLNLTPYSPPQCK